MLGYEDITKPIKEAFTAADSLEDLDQRLFSLYKEMNSSKLEKSHAIADFNAFFMYFTYQKYGPCNWFEISHLQFFLPHF